MLNMKKKLLVFAILMFSVSYPMSQMNQGAFLLGGLFDFNYRTGNKTTFTEMTVAPTAGLFLAENMGIGASVGFTSNSSKINGSTVNSATTVELSPFSRYYYSGNAFGQFDIPINLSKNATFDFGSKLKLGYDFFLTESVALEPSLYAGFYFGRQAKTNNTTDNLKYQYLSTGFDISLQIFLNRK